MIDVYFDGLVGPTHNYSGLSFGNLASMEHAARVSNPKEAALQGLKKMKLIHDLGIPQALFPPQERPSPAYLRTFGFQGSDAQVIEQAAQKAPELLYAASSASSMWAANSATVTPSSDSFDGKVHFTIANLQSQFHRSLEAQETLKLFRKVFCNPEVFTIHPPLPFPDEGAANHIRFHEKEALTGVHLYVYGKSLFANQVSTFPARQTKEASEAIARSHGGKAVFAQQSPHLIDQGVFHNDVIACGSHNLFLYHKEAYLDTENVLKQLGQHLPLQPICVELSVQEAVKTYLFNSQILTLPDHTLLLLAPEECRALNLDWLPIPLAFIDVRQSMQNGGGPACLRLAVPLTEEQIRQVHQPLFLTESLYTHLVHWVEKYYRDRLTPKDLHDPALLRDSQEALDSLSSLLDLGSFYSFQQLIKKH